MDIEKSGYIKLPYGFISKENDKGKLRFNLPLNYKKNVLFEKVPYFAEVNNKAINDVVLGKKKDELSIQKFLLGKGVLEDAILENLDMIVTDRKFNNAGIRRKLDKKYPSIMKKPTASNFLFRDKKQFDLQNPVIGGLYNQLKIRTADQLELLKKAPKIKDLKIQNALDRLKKFNLNRGAVDDDDDDDNDDIPGLPPSRRPYLNDDDNDDDDDDGDDDDDNNNNNNNDRGSDIQKFLLGNEKIGEAFAESSAGVEPRKIAVSKEITKIFPKIKEEELDFGEADKDDFEDKEDVDFLDKTDKYDFPIETTKTKTKTANLEQDFDFDFYVGGDKNSKKLMANAVSNIGQLNDSNKMFLEFLSSGFGRNILLKNKLKIHLESGQFFHNNIITNESIYDFLSKQQDETKKELLIEVPSGDDFEVYVRELLTNVKDDEYDLHTNSTAKFLFYYFNTYRLINRLNPLTIRHSQIITNQEAISILQTNNWQYFVEQLLHIANGEINLDDFDLDNDQEFEKYNIIEKTSDNINYCRQFCEEVFNDIAYFFYKMITETPDEFLEPLKADLANEIYYTQNLKEIESHVELLKIFNRFYFKTGRFPGDTNFIFVPAGQKPDFVKSFDQISPVELNEKFQNGPSYGIAAVHFLAGLNIYFNGEKKLSQNVISELLHNLSYQALSIDNKKYNIKFDEVIKLNKNIKRLIRDVDRQNIETLKFERAIDNTKDKVEAMEEEVVNNILTNEKVEFPVDFKPPMPNTVSEIENDIKKVKAIKRKTNESLNEIYGEITRDVVTKARKDLVKSITDYEGETPIEVINNITSSYKEEKPIKKSVSKHVKQSIKYKNQQHFKQKKPTITKKEKNITPKLKITDIVNRNLRSNSVTSIPLNDIEMLSRSASLDSIATLKDRYNDDDEEMISRASSLASIRDSSNKELSFKQPSQIKPKTIDVKPKQSLIETDKTLTAAAKVVLLNKKQKNNKTTTTTTMTKKQFDTPLSAAVRAITTKKDNPPSISLTKSIDKSQKQKTQTKQQQKQIEKKAAAAKADIKTKQQEQVVKWRNKGEDVEMILPVIIGKRKKDIGLQSEAKTKKEN